MTSHDGAEGASHDGPDELMGQGRFFGPEDQGEAWETRDQGRAGSQEAQSEDGELGGTNRERGESVIKKEPGSWAEPVTMKQPGSRQSQRERARKQCRDETARKLSDQQKTWIEETRQNRQGQGAA